jgi:protein SCO1/2
VTYRIGWRWLAGLGLLFGALSGCRERPAPGEIWLPARPAADFEAYGVRRAGVVSSCEERGRAFVLAFGYTSCADVCPATLATIHDVYAHLGSRASEVDAFYVSVDPERDRPDRFRGFLEHFDQRIEGLRIEPPALGTVLAAYGITAIKRPPTIQHYVGHDIDPSTDYSFDHSAGLLVVDPLGRLRIHYALDADPEVIARGLRRVLDEPGPRLRVSNARLVLYRPEVGAGYLELYNGGNAAERLTGAVSVAARAVDLHTLVSDGDMVRMRPAQDGFAIDTSQTLALAPGGKHLMFEGLAVPGGRRTVPVVLAFEREAPLRVDFAVVEPGRPSGSTAAQAAAERP